MTKRLHLSLNLLFLCFIFSACSSLSSINPFASNADESGQGVEDNGDLDAAEAPTAPQTETPAAEKKASRMEGTSTLEVLWQVPSEAVEKYHFYYGLEPDKLDNHIVVPISELQKTDHPKHGPVFRYELREVPANRAIYLSLRAENKYGISDPSAPTKVEPGQRSVSPK